jgi:hypothetical protein
VSTTKPRLWGFFAVIALLDATFIVVKVSVNVCPGVLFSGVLFAIGLLYALGYGGAEKAERWSTAALGITSGIAMTLLSLS